MGIQVSSLFSLSVVENCTVLRCVCVCVCVRVRRALWCVWGGKVVAVRAVSV